MTSSDRFPVPVRSAVKSNSTDWCCQNLSKRALNALTVQASTTELGKLFQTFTMRAEINAFVSHKGLSCCCLCDPTFSRFSRTPTCDTQTQTDRHRPMASTADA